LKLNRIWHDEAALARLTWGAMAIYLGGLAIASALRYQGDFAIYYRAGQRVWTGASLYPANEGDRFLYAPVFALVFAPLAKLPRPLAQLLWFIPNALALPVLVRGAGRMLFDAERCLPAALVGLPTLFCARFIDNNMEHGQLDLLVLALAVWTIVRAREGRCVAAGALLAPALLSKPLAFSGALYLLATRRWRAILFSALFIGVLLILPILFFGPERAAAETLGYVHAVRSMTSRYRQTLINQAVGAVVFRALLQFGKDYVFADCAAGVVGSVYALIAFLALWLWLAKSEYPTSGDMQRALALGALFSLTPSLSAIAWKHYFVALIIPYMALLSVLQVDRPSGWHAPRSAWVLFVSSILLNLAVGNTLNRLALFYGAHLLSSLAVLAALIITFRAIAPIEVQRTPQCRSSAVK
jgi:hypothetical protein